jgi:hypothetical protein
MEVKRHGVLIWLCSWFICVTWCRRLLGLPHSCDRYSLCILFLGISAVGDGYECKVRAVTLQASQAHRGGRRIALPMLDPAVGRVWVVSAAP